MLMQVGIHSFEEDIWGYMVRSLFYDTKQILTRRKKTKEQSTDCSFRDLTLRPSYIAIALKMIPAMLLLTFGYVVLGECAKGLHGEAHAFTIALQTGLFRIGRVFILVELLRRRFNFQYRLKKHGIIVRNGLLSTKLGIARIKYRDIREIRVEQDVVGRIFNYGNLLIGTASTGDHEIEFRQVSNPRQIAHWIQTERVEKSLHRLRAE